MRRKTMNAALGLGLAAASVAAQTPAPAPAPPAAAKSAAGPEFGFAVSGYYEWNAHTQRNFFFGKGASGLLTDRDAYAVQLFRVQPEFSYGPSLRAVLRIDLAQGVFGLDDELRDNDRPGFSNLYSRKDSNSIAHVDWAYVEFTPEALRGFGLRVGRMKNQLGGLLALDQDGDGVQVFRALGKWKLTADWTKMSEGPDALTDGTFPGLDGRDADLFYLDAQRPLGKGSLAPFVALYTDRNRAQSYVPQGEQYFRARFTPNLSRLWIFGAAFEAQAGRLKLKGEAEWLTGRDEIRNRDSGPRELLDVNDGTLRGSNLLLDARLPLLGGTLGAVFGRGSGDDDPTSGRGNVNKVRTNGFFYLTEVWEDSLMPDEEGLTPQGLGSPGHRGYRELENTTLLQLSFGRKLGRDWNAFASATWLRATEPLRPWRDQNGDGVIAPAEFDAARARDLGFELDGKLDFKVMPNLLWTLRGGILFPGAAAGYLINGTDAFQKDAWELRTTLRFDFKLPAKKS